MSRARAFASALTAGARPPQKIAQSTMYASIDKAADIISRRLQKLKERDEHGGMKKHSKVCLHSTLSFLPAHHTRQRSMCGS